MKFKMFSYRLRTSLQSGVKSALFNQKPVHSAAPQSASISQGTQFFKARYDVDTRSEEQFATPFQYKSTIASISPKHYANEHATGKKLFGPATVTGSALRTIVPLRMFALASSLSQNDHLQFFCFFLITFFFEQKREVIALLSHKMCKEW